MKSPKKYTKPAMFACGFLLSVGIAQAVDISGTISSTLTIFDNSQLVGNVTCTVVGAPCIKFGADRIKLRLNGYAMTGLADPTTGCGPTSASSVPRENGINTDGHSRLEILGPGLVQNFRRSGVVVNNGSTRVKVRHVTASTTCISGILLFNNANDNDIEENVAVRNGNLAPVLFAFACGGIEVALQSNNNRIRRNETSGNGYAGPPNDDFGIDLFDSHGNLVEENSAVGNTNGILVSPTSSGNVVRRNVVTGNPPLQVSLSLGDFGGVDILNFSPSGANTFEDNLCLTSNVSGLCPHIPNFAGHKNGNEGER